MKSDPDQLLEFAVELARGAGDITLNYFRKQPETSHEDRRQLRHHRGSRS